MFVIPCSVVANGCAASAIAAGKAAEDIGWDVTLIDPAGDATQQNNAIDGGLERIERGKVDDCGVHPGSPAGG